MRAFVERLRRRIAIKLAVTLVGLVSLILLVAGFALNRALEALAVEALEARLAAVGTLLHDDARALLVGGAPGADLDALARRAGRLSMSSGALRSLSRVAGRPVWWSEAHPRG